MWVIQKILKHLGLDQPNNDPPEFMANALLHGLERLDIAFDVRR
jgi:hypothetical protein